MNIKSYIKNSKLYPLLLRILTPSVIKISGKNKILKSRSLLKNCHFEIIGQNNEVILDDVFIENSMIRILGNDNIIKIGKESFIKNATFHIEDNNGAIILGTNVCISGKTQLSVIEGTKINIGDCCLFSTNVMLATGDSHSILDEETGHRINQSKDIEIGNHVWFGHDTTVLKGVSIADNVIVGACAVVSKSFCTSNIALAGNPAKIVKKCINWSFDRF